MRCTARLSAACTNANDRRWRLRLVLFLVRIWLRCDCARLYAPFAVGLKRFAAPRLVFIFGIVLIRNGSCPLIWDDTHMIRPMVGHIE